MSRFDIYEDAINQEEANLRDLIQVTRFTSEPSQMVWLESEFDKLPTYRRATYVYRGEVDDQEYSVFGTRPKNYGKDYHKAVLKDTEEELEDRMRGDRVPPSNKPHAVRR